MNEGWKLNDDDEEEEEEEDRATKAFLMIND